MELWRRNQGRLVLTDYRTQSTWGGLDRRDRNVEKGPGWWRCWKQTLMVGAWRVLECWWFLDDLRLPRGSEGLCLCRNWRSLFAYASDCWRKLKGTVSGENREFGQVNGKFWVEVHCNAKQQVKMLAARRSRARPSESLRQCYSSIITKQAVTAAVVVAKRVY